LWAPQRNKNGVTPMRRKSAVPPNAWESLGNHPFAKDRLQKLQRKLRKLRLPPKARPLPIRSIERTAKVKDTDGDDASKSFPPKPKPLRIKHRCDVSRFRADAGRNRSAGAGDQEQSGGSGAPAAPLIEKKEIRA